MPIEYKVVEWRSIAITESRDIVHDAEDVKNEGYRCKALHPRLHWPKGTEIPPDANKTICEPHPFLKILHDERLAANAEIQRLLNEGGGRSCQTVFNDYSRRPTKIGGFT